jgi:hypothetical protein
VRPAGLTEARAVDQQEACHDARGEVRKYPQQTGGWSSCRVAVPFVDRNELQFRLRHPHLWTLDAAIRQARVGVAAAPAQEPSLNQEFEELAALGFVESPQAARLGARQLQAGHLHEFAADSL